MSRVKLENAVVSSSEIESEMERMVGVPRDGSSLDKLMSSRRGQEAGSRLSQAGPVHHKELLVSAMGDSPRKRMSAGLQRVDTYLQLAMGVSSVIFLTLLAMNVSRVSGLRFSQPSTMAESVQRKTEDRGIWRSVAMEELSWASIKAPHSSSRGMVCPVTGASLDLEEISFTDTDVSL